MNTSMKASLTSAAMVLGLLAGVAACSSDETTESTTAPTVDVADSGPAQGSVAADLPATAASTASTAATAATAATGQPPIDTSAVTAGAGDEQAGLTVQQELAQLQAEFAAANNLPVDIDCLNEYTAQLTDADAQLLLDAGVTGSVTVTLSPAGEALKVQVLSCLVPPTS